MPCIWFQADWVIRRMAKDLMVVVFAMAAGFTLSGITANFYRLCVGHTDKDYQNNPHLLVMVVAGPSVMIERAAASLRAQTCTKPAFWLASALAGYWSFVLGLFLLDIAVTMKGW
ncbi:MAG: hypothetical protein JOZ55_06270 [Alphaproteobacteria bacterium]|nr:hypothetical protein [Alphaproteobacteria bacterium]